MQAQPHDQHVLLDVAALDQEAAKINHQKKTLPMLAELAELAASRSTIVEDKVAKDTQITDAKAVLARVNADLDPAKQRFARNQKMADDGSLAAKQLQQVLDENEHLAGRIAKLEDEQLAAEIAVEELEAERSKIMTGGGQIEKRMRELITQRDQQLAELDAKITADNAQRDELRAQLPVELLKIYDRAAARNLTGAAKYLNGKCEGCRIQLDAEQSQQVARASVTQIVLCPNCNRILVRQ